MTQPKQPPPGVETTPGGPVVSLSEAAKRLGKDPRTVIRAISAGEIRGGAMPRPERLRWYVYADELAPPPGATPPPPSADIDGLRAQLVSLTEANRLLIAAQQDLLDADSSTSAAADKYRAVARNYLDALAQFMTPGNLGELADQL
ncbi:hypothetical protein [Mycobacterium sp.]|uniref:hypothetical protein n=1 Tax=Mycobacterium sp. TaxID=1785 RepID=UPI003D1513B4